METERVYTGIAAKVLAVMKAVEKIAKDKHNDFHKYMYASDEAIITAVRQAMINAKLVALPHQMSCVQNNDMTTLQIEYTLMDADSGESIKSVVYGQGQDKGDKGAYKAATGAEKYFFLKTFLIPTTDDPEKDTTKAAATRGGQVAKAPVPKPQPPPKQQPAKREPSAFQKSQQNRAKGIVNVIAGLKSVDEADAWFEKNGTAFKSGFTKATIDYVLLKFKQKHSALMKAEGGE